MGDSSKRTVLGTLSKATSTSGTTSSAGSAPSTSTSSDYLARTRESDPWPPETTEATDKIQILSAEFLTPAEDFAVGQPFRMKARIRIQETTSRPRIQFTVFARIAGSSTEWTTASTHDGFFTPGAVGTEMDVEASGDLLLSMAMAGDTVDLRLTASHSEASAEGESSLCTILCKTIVHVVEVPDILFSVGSPLPGLDTKGWLVNALASAIAYAHEKAPLDIVDKNKRKSIEELMIFGHSDASGDNANNYILSEKRAQAIQSLLNCDANAWATLCPEAHVKDWQQTLLALASTYYWPCHPGKVDGIAGPQSQKAAQAFQQTANRQYSLGLKEDGVVGPKTWNAIHRVLCGLVATRMRIQDPASATYPALPKPIYSLANDSGVYGCGESFPTSATSDTTPYSEADRRVELLFLPVDMRELSPPPDPNRRLQPEECPPYNPKAVKRIAIPLYRNAWSFSE